MLSGVYQIELYHNPCRGTLDVYMDQAGQNTGFSDGGLHLTRDVVEAVVGGSGYGDGLLHKIYFDE